MQHLLLMGRKGTAHLHVGVDGVPTTAQQLGFPLMYSWHGKASLGAIHGAHHGRAAAAELLLSCFES